MYLSTFQCTLASKITYEPTSYQSQQRYCPHLSEVISKILPVLLLAKSCHAIAGRVSANFQPDIIGSFSCQKPTNLLITILFHYFFYLFYCRSVRMLPPFPCVSYEVTERVQVPMAARRRSPV